MRLGKLKLAGFKSFVDPTTAVFPTAVTGVVGPNGCGKSNIIDAIRWVLGESSAKHLRGESMADVIFNGSVGRKASGQASVELVFEDTLGAVSGEFARFNEIAIKRIVSRDGQSNYYINNTRCRKKDIVDLFLGTGLGSRSYSIIEQGMISRVIEAKPEDLRVYLEEAAGISKYKERRRETENRIRHTKENLERVQDILEELTKQLEKLKRQAEVAEKFKLLRVDEDKYHSELLALQWQTHDETFEALQKDVKQGLLDINAKESEKQSCITSLETLRAQQQEQFDYLDEEKKSFYSLATEIAKIEQVIQHEKEKLTKLNADLEQYTLEYEKAKEELTDDIQQKETLEQTVQDLTPELEDAKQVVVAAEEALNMVEETRAAWQEKWDACAEQSAYSSQQAHIEKTRIHHLEEKIQSQEKRIQKLNDNTLYDERKKLLSEIELVKADWQTTDAEIRNNKEALDVKQEEIQVLKSQTQDLRPQIKEASKILQETITEKVSLEAMQKAALGYERSDAESKWLNQYQLQDNKRLAESITVEQGWEKAVETVLANELESILVGDEDVLFNALNDLSEGQLSFLISRQNGEAPATVQDSLAAKVQHLPESLAAYLSSIYVADTLDAALQMKAKLKVNESVILPNGVWIGRDWVRVSFAQDNDDSVIKREQKIKELNQLILEQRDNVEQLEAALQEAESALQTAEETREQLRAEQRQVENKFSEVKSDLNVKQNRLRDIEQRQIKISEELTQLQKELGLSQHEIKTTKKAWQEAVDAMGRDSEKKENLQAEKEIIDENLQSARHHLQESQQGYYEVEVKLETTKSQIHSVELNIERVKGRIAQFEVKLDAIQTALSDDKQPEEELRAQLSEFIEQHQALEKVIKQEEDKLKGIDAEIKSVEVNMNMLQKQLDELNQMVNQRKVDSQTSLVKRTTIEEQLQEEGFPEAKAILSKLEENADIKEWSDNLNRIRDRIKRLGAINLAAIEEYDQEAERKIYLDEQYADLEKALLTLEDAIAKIDKETRTRFKACYEQVNQSFKSLFPRLFGGGNAYLELTGEDLLDTGVQVIARPPGKKNSSIHLLSGGEKAMTAVALVFSIFQLNPSPFCLLDEVDAPLDDANVTRYCNMVREMSDKTQFIIITHNKLAMEIAQSLTGVTMQEPGVSRLVSVDVDEAVRLTEA